MNNKFYPTPKTLLDKIFSCAKWSKIQTVLEPSSGKGDMAAYIQEQCQETSYRKVDIDCIEKEPKLQHILKGTCLRTSTAWLPFTTCRRASSICGRNSGMCRWLPILAKSCICSCVILRSGLEK